MSFGIAVMLMGGAMSMSRRQPYGKGWLGGECYLVKDGTYIGSAILVLVTIGSSLGSAVITKRKGQADKSQKVHSQVAWQETDNGELYPLSEKTEADLSGPTEERGLGEAAKKNATLFSFSFRTGEQGPAQ